jgi:hypothetical protein
MKLRMTAFALLIFALSAISARTQTISVPFTLSWQANTAISTRFAVHSLLSYNNRPAPSSVCGYSPERYDIWCGEVIQYVSPATFDFNFPDGFLLGGCSQGSLVSNIAPTLLIDPTTGLVYTLPTRRTITTKQSFVCADANNMPYTVDTITKTKQYQASCGRYACWQTFGPGQQTPITGTVTQEGTATQEGTPTQD